MNSNEELDSEGCSLDHINNYVEMITTWPELTRSELLAFFKNLDNLQTHPLVHRKLAQKKMHELERVRLEGEEKKYKAQMLKEKNNAAKSKAIDNLLKFLDHEDDKIRLSATKEALKGVIAGDVKLAEVAAELEGKEHSSDSEIKIDAADKEL